MTRYAVLTSWTDEGARAVNDTVARAEQVRTMVEQMGGRLDPLYWTQGRYDLISVLEAPDEETAAAIVLRVGATGTVRNETLRAYDAEEMGRILSKFG